MTSIDPLAPSRYSTRPFPPYSYVPGSHPHPVSDPRGHMHGRQPQGVDPLDPAACSASEPYRYAIDLFNHGYYWEAHEVWEGLWLAAGRRGATAEVLQGLIKLAAAGVKVREGRPAGTHFLAQGARELFTRAAAQLPGKGGHLGLRFEDLEAFTSQAEACVGDRPDDDPGGRIVFPFVLEPRLESTA